MTERTDLGSFLRARREALTPSDVGLREGGRRRTPGLRREEVATLAGISIDYLVRLEQGRDVNPSREVVAALAQALQLTDMEYKHLTMLVAKGDRADLCPQSSRPAVETVAPTVRLLLEQLQPTPAFVSGPSGNVLAWNPAWEQVARPLGLIDGDPPNLARYVFCHPAARSVYADWAAAADEQVATLRQVSVCQNGDPHLDQLLADLRAVPDFARRWSRHAVAEKRRGTKTLRCPERGELHIDFEVLTVADDDQRLITWLAADEATAQRLAPWAEPAAEGRRLRLVGES